MKRILGLLLLSFCFTHGFGQRNCKIKNAYAFYSTSTPGVQMQGEDGNPVPVKTTISRFIYIEWKGKKEPQIEMVSYDNINYSVTISAEEGNTATLGPSYANNPDFNVRAKKCNRLWKLSLQDAIQGEIPELNCTNIIIKGEACVFTVNRETPLMTLPRY